MVVYDNMKMFDLAVELGAAINILNNQQLTPLSTASFLARTEMFFHIANLEREVYWQIGTFCVTLQFIIIDYLIPSVTYYTVSYTIPGNVTCSAYPIAQLDSIDSKTGELNTVSALNLIVFGVSVKTHRNYNPYHFQEKDEYCIDSFLIHKYFFQSKVEHLDLIEGIIVDILKTKWKSFISRR